MDGELCMRRAVIVWCICFWQDLVRGLEGAAQRFIKKVQKKEEV